LRFYETPANADGSFTLDNIAPGKYWVLSRRTDDGAAGTIKSARQDTTLRRNILKEAESLNNIVTVKPCEELRDFSLKYAGSKVQP